MTRDDRARELRRLRHESPQQLIALYRAATGTDELEPLPPGVSFSSMIDTILEFEHTSPKRETKPRLDS